MPNLAKSAAKISHVRAVPADLHDNHYRIFVVSSLKNALGLSAAASTMWWRNDGEETDERETINRGGF